MILLVIAIVVALILFTVLRSLFFPFLIMAGIGFLVHQFKGDEGGHQYSSSSYQTSPRASETSRHTEEVQISDNIHRDVQISRDQMAICRYVSDASRSFLLLEKEWDQSEKLDNKISTKIAHERLKPQIEKILKDRNEKIFSYLGINKPHITKWNLYVKDYIYTDGDDGGFFTANLISPCSPEILVKIYMYTPKKSDLPILASISNGSIIEVSGDLLPKYDGEGLTPNNIEWGGAYLWGSYGNLAGHAMFESPEFDISPTSFLIPSHR